MTNEAVIIIIIDMEAAKIWEKLPGDQDTDLQEILAQAVAWRELRKIVSIIYTSGIDSVSARTFCCLMDQLHDGSDSDG